MELETNNKDDVDKARTSARGEYLATAFLLSSDRRQYGELILALKKKYAKQNWNYPKRLTNMYGLVVSFKPTRVAVVTGGHNEGHNFGNVATDSESGGTGDVGGRGDGARRNRECCNCGEDQ